MDEKRRGRAQLLKEIEELREQIKKLKKSEAARKKTTKRLAESEQIFRIIFDSAMDGILVANLETKKLHIANNALCQMLGYPRDELLSLSIPDIHPEEAMPYVNEQIKKQTKGEISLAKDIPVKRKDGSIFYADVNSAILDIGDSPFILGVFRDISEQKKALEALQKSEEKYRDLFENINDLVQSVRPDGSFAYVNRSWHETLGYTAEELPRLTLFDIIHPDNMEYCKRLFERVMSGENIQHAEAKFITCLLYTSPSPRDLSTSRMPSSA